MNTEKKLLGLIFDFIDDYQQYRDELLKKIASLYNVDDVDMTNLFLDYTWASQDGVSKEDVLLRTSYRS